MPARQRHWEGPVAPTTPPVVALTVQEAHAAASDATPPTE